MRWLVIASLVALCACSSKISDAEKKYEIVKKSGGAAEICAQGKAVVAAYLEAKDTAGYERQSAFTAVDCTAARNREADGIYRMPDGTDAKIEPDNMLGGT